MSKQYNRDYLIGQNMPRAGYAIHGSDWAINKGKDAPMIVNLNSPGIYANDWVNTYGSSLDSFLSIVDGFNLLDAVESVPIVGIYRDGFPNTKTENVWAKVEPSTEGNTPTVPVQQIQYVVSGGDIEAGRERVDDFGNLFNARGLCVRGPMMMCGYGRTKEMLPINPDGNNPRLNSEDSKLDRSLWKVGTVDLRWDERRNVWGAWNDMIADQEGKGLGTTVFSTNPDTAQGFPRLKGKLQDVWWVRQSTAFASTDGKIEGVQTGEVMTHLNHKFFDKDTNGSAKLSTIFVIPHDDASEEDNGCHEKGDEQSLGDETTGDGLGIDIKSTVHFWKENEVDGPIKFGRKLSDLGDEICCDSSTLKTNPRLFIGEMIFMDEELPTCDDDPGEGGESEEKPPCEWVPAVSIDECSLVAGICETLVSNDINTITRLDALCTEVNAYSEDIQGVQEGNNNSLVGGIGNAIGAAAAVAQSVNTALAGMAAAIASAFSAIQSTHTSEMIAIYSDVNAALAACECESVIVYGGGENVTPQIPGGGVPIPIGGSVVVSPLPKFDCDQCVPVKIKAPCSNEPDTELSIGVGCGGGEIPEPDYEDTGPCAANEG